MGRGCAAHPGCTRDQQYRHRSERAAGRRDLGVRAEEVSSAGGSTEAERQGANAADGNVRRILRCAHECASASHYFPSRSTLSFSFWFISRTLGSGLCCPVVWVVEGGVALALGSEFWSGVLGRVAVVGGVVLLWAYAPVAVKRKALDSNETASAFEIWVIDLLLSDRCKRREAALCSRLYASNCLPSGRLRMRFPVAAKMAFISAGANGGTPGSPTPLGGVSGPGGTM